ncbi:hypothetical protein KEJ26_05390 [Candidatus Bathyarchaeota archaeon]|nr:hypothetical protein [Candidatus Bathyarchaeota archaeon]
MARLKKPINYIEDLCASQDVQTRQIGFLLKRNYRIWTTNLKLHDFEVFLSTIQRHKEKIGLAQFFGKFRAYAFEEYVYRLIKSKIPLPRGFDVFWGEEVQVLLEKDRAYNMEVDISIGRPGKYDSICPTVVVDCKVEIDASRLKTAMASFAILKQFIPDVNCFLVYMKKDVSDIFFQLVCNWIDGAYDISTVKDESKRFIKNLTRVLQKYNRSFI